MKSALRSSIVRLLFFALCLFLLPRKVLAQGCIGVMTPAFSSYSTYSLDASNNIYSTVVVDGYANIHPSEYCYINLAEVRHYGMVYNKLGSVGGWVYGPYQSPTAYISVSNPQEIAAEAGIVYTNSTETDVECSAVGGIYSEGAA